jgi:phenylpropionate dioxygenase-like ring-hydroxylating dioxygenase large terminal subunit
VETHVVNQLLGEAPFDDTLANYWFPIAPEKELVEGIPTEKFLLGRSIVIWKSQGSIYVRRNYCPHEGSRFTSPNPKARAVVEGANLTCAYHGWQYGEDGIGFHFPSNTKKGKSKQFCIDVYPVQLAYGWVWTCLGSTAAAIPSFPEWDDTSFRKVGCGPYQANTSWGRSVLNVCDVSHFPFVHENILGTKTETNIPPYEVNEAKGGGLEALNVKVWQPNPDGSGVGSWVAYDYFVPQPHIIRFCKAMDEKHFVMYFAITPTSETTCTWFAWMALNYENNTSDASMTAFQDSVTQDDLDVLAGVRPQKLLLDLKLGYPIIPADRFAIAYRKYLHKLGITYGVVPVE